MSRALAVVLVLLSAEAVCCGQIPTLPPGMPAVDEILRRVQTGNNFVAIGHPAAFVMALPGARAEARGRRIRLPGGILCYLEGRTHVEQIQVTAPYQGMTRRGIALGATAFALHRAYPETHTVIEGWNQANVVAFKVEQGRVSEIRINGRQPNAPPVGPPEQPPVVTPHPNHPHPRGPGAPTLIWEHVWDANDRWLDVPPQPWPTDRGRLLVRVAHGPGVHSIDQQVGRELYTRTPAKDTVLAPDHVERAVQRNGGAPSWRWKGVGSGRIKVAILWFPREDRLERHLAENPYGVFAASSGAGGPPVVRPSPEELLYEQLKHDVTLIWDYAWGVDHQTGWVRGPTRNWDSEKGMLLLRAWGSPGVRGVAFRAGRQGPLNDLPLGDHLIDPGILEVEGRRFGPFSGDRQLRALHLSGRGEGRIRCQVFWVPDRTIAPLYCRHHIQPAIAPVATPDEAVRDPRSAPGFMLAAFTGSLTDESGQPFSGVDVFAQQATWPLTIYGGARTNIRGEFDFSVSVPAGIPVMLRCPEIQQQSRPHFFQPQDPTFCWQHQLK